MESRVFRTSLKCASCVAKLAPVLDADPRVVSWSVAVDDQRKPLTLTGTDVGPDFAKWALRNAGFDVLDEISDPSRPPRPPWYKTYFPILLILAYLCAFVALSQIKAGEWSWMSAMRNFMGGFFTVFSFFKLLNLSGFVDAYASYDVVAKRLRAYGYIYPFIELGLGAAYLASVGGLMTDLVTFSVMTLSTAGVVHNLLKRHAIQCACLGTVFKLPMSRVTLIEDLAMVSMSAVMAGATILHSAIGQ